MDNSQNNKRIVETASATSSRDDNHSGAFAYVLSGVVLVILVLVTLVGAGCTAFVIDAAAANEADWSAESYDYPYPDYDVQDQDVEDMGLDELIDYYLHDIGLDDEDDGEGDSSASLVSVSDALDFELACYGTNIDELVKANAYDGVTSETRSYIREFLKTDKDYAERLKRIMNAAVTDEDGRAGHLDEAKDLCKEATSALADMDAPKLKDDEDGTVSDLLGTAREEASKRWDALGREVELLDSADKVDKNELWDLDDEVLELTQDAADHIMEAMSN